MTILFGEYELIAKSGLFDAAFYVRSNPDVAALNVDPLLHYLEYGARERRNPSAVFDTHHYFSLCAALGETPVNALVHYLTVGIDRGLTPHPGGQANQRSAHSLPADRAAGGVARAAAGSMLNVDLPRLVDGRADAPVQGGLSIVGWGVAAGGAVGVDIAVDGVRVTSARYGIRRQDVAAAHPGRADAVLSGFAAHVPPKALPVGRHQVAVCLRDRDGEVARVEFAIDVQKVDDERGHWSLRRKMNQAEVDLKLAALGRLDWHPRFRVHLRLDSSAVSVAAARRTLDSLARQTYADWELWLIPMRGKGTAGAAAGRKALPSSLADEWDDLAPRIRVCDQNDDGGGSAERGTSAASAAPCWFLVLAPGDVLGCDALLEFALASGSLRGAEFFYCDERRLDPADRTVDAFFKPAWSPDLHLSTNYLGRAWCADRDLLGRVGIDAKALGEISDYDLSLRLTEAARGIGHVAKVLHERGSIGGDSAKQELTALGVALKRRGISAEILPGCLPTHYRIRRQRKPGRVSIIIPTCAAEGLIKTCLESLRARTAYQNYEIICIENIPRSRRSWKQWLKGQADGVITTTEAFNWSRYNNLAAKRARGEHLLFLNDDVEIIEPEWLDALLEQGQRVEVGVVGPLLLYPNRTVQQAGVMLDYVGRGRHAFRHQAEHDPGYFGLALTQRNVISVTGACLLTRRQTFDTLAGFEEAHAVINNDLDYCLRALRHGLINVYTPHAKLIHHELVSRSQLDEHYDFAKFDQQWRDVIVKGDPYFNRNLSRDHESFTIEREGFDVVYAGQPLFAAASVRRILVVKLDHIGDCITALPAVRRLKSHFPEARISVLAAPGTHAIWNSEPAVDEAIEFSFFHARSGAGRVEVSVHELDALKARLAVKRFDLAIDLRKQPDTRHILECSGARILVGFDAAGGFPWLDVALEWDEDVPLRSKHGHVAFDLVALVEAVATRCAPDRGALLTRPQGELALPAAERRRLYAKPLICVHPAAGSAMRQWPPESFAELIRLFVDLRRFNVAIIGGNDEKELADRVLQLVARPGEVINLVGRLALAELPKVLADSVLFVGNNSGPHHWAAGLGVPTVGIHSGVVDAREWGPLGPQAVAVRRDMSCSPCFIEHAEDCPRKLACLKELAVADVYDACMSMI